MVNTAEADVVCPAVTTEDPLRLLSQEVLILQDILEPCHSRMLPELLPAYR